jgi:hypothetical protein
MEAGVPVGLDLSSLLVYSLSLNKLEIVVSKGIQWWLCEKEVDGGTAVSEADHTSARLCKPYADLLEGFRSEVVRVGEQVVSGQGEGKLVFRENRIEVSVGQGHDQLRFAREPAQRRRHDKTSKDREWRGTALGWHFEYTKAEDSGKKKATTAPPQLLLENDGGPKTTKSKKGRKGLRRAAQSRDN